MKQILIILGLFASVTTFAQSPRIKLNQITKDTVKGSVLISSPSDSGMVYSRDFYIAYGADTVLILYGDTLAATSGIISSVLSDGVTITGNGTSGNELKVDTSLIATIKALNDSLATISASTTPDNVTITGDGSVGNPLKVDTLLIATIKGLNDTLTARGYLTANQTITLSGDVTGSGTTAITATVVDDSHDHIISNVDFLQDSLDAKANDSDLANYVTLSGAETITGAKTFTNTFTQSGGDANFDSGTLYVDATTNRVGIGTTNLGVPLEVNGSARFNGLSIGTYNASNTPIDLKFNSSSAQIFRFWNEGTGGAKMRFISDDNAEASHQWTVSSAWLAQIAAGYNGTNQNNNYMDFRVRGASDAGTEAGLEAATKMRILGNGNVGIGTSSPSEKLTVRGRINLLDAGNSIYIGDSTGVSDDLTDNRNIGIGTKALYTNTSSYWNVAIGDLALSANTSGLTNLAIGKSALEYNTSGSNNVALGVFSVRLNTSGDNNMGIGYQALGLNTSGSKNVGIGFRSLLFNETGSDNVAIGYEAGRYYGSGSSNLTNANGSFFIGTNSRASANNSSNEIVIGTNAIGNGNNSITIGNDGTIGTATSKVVINGVGTTGGTNSALYITSTGELSTSSSDQRLKTNINPLDSELNTLMNLNPVKYNYYDDLENEAIGFIAQELEIYYPNLVFTNPISNYKGVHYHLFAPIITKAIQEQQAIIETQASEIDQLKTLITDLTNRIQILENK